MYFLTASKLFATRKLPSETYFCLMIHFKWIYLSFLEQWWTKTLLCMWSKVSRDRRSSLWWDGSCSQPCVSVSYGSLPPCGMFCASASGNSLHAFVGQHSVKHSRGTLFSIGTVPCSTPSHPLCDPHCRALLTPVPLEEPQALPGPPPHALSWKSS